MLYKPLLPDEIRLITIQPSHDPVSQVRCRLDCFDFTERFYADDFAASSRNPTSAPGVPGRPQPQKLDEPLEAEPMTSSLPEFRYVWGDYMALSYTWGDPKVTRAISVNGNPMQVTVNLEKALKALRSQPYVKAGWKMWIDAICINQEDLEERAVQVKRMRDIYRRAWTPIIWLGAASADSDRAIELIPQLSTAFDNPHSVVELNDALKKDPKVFGEGSWRALHDFALRGYFRRVWIVQEASIGNGNMPVLCGDRVLRWTDIHGAFKFLGRTDEILNVYMARELADVGRSIDGAIHLAIGTASKIDTNQRETKSGSKAPDLFRTMTISRLVSATDPRDKVYGLLALLGEEVTRRIIPDYSAPVEKVYTDFAELVINVTRSVDILRHVAPDDSPSLPSWVPDWRSPNRLCSLGNIPHRASGRTMAEVSCPRHGVLSCRGFVVDTLDGLGCEWRDASGAGWPPSTVRQAVGRENPYRDFEGVREAIWRTMVSNRNTYTTVLEEDYSALLAVPAIFKAKGHLCNKNLEDLAASHLFSYCVRFFQGNRDFMIAGAKISRFFVPEPNFAKLDPSVLRNALAARDKVNLYRRLFTTSKGFVGMGVQGILPSDVICILYGSSMPMVLREVNGEFMVVGECYVHGLMDGEGLEMLQRQEGVARDFNIR